MTCTSAALDTGYSQRPVCATLAEMLVKFTIEPLPTATIAGRTARAIITALTTLTLSADCQSERGDSAPLSV